MGADYVSAITALAGMAATALAHKKKLSEQKSDNRNDAAFDIRMQQAASLGDPGASYVARAHDALVGNQRLDRQPVDYGDSLKLLGKSLAGSDEPDKKAQPSAAATTDLLDPWAAESQTIGKPVYQQPDWQGINPWDDPEFRRNHPDELEE